MAIVTSQNRLHKPVIINNPTKKAVSSSAFFVTPILKYHALLAYLLSHPSSLSATLPPLERGQKIKKRHALSE